MAIALAQVIFENSSGFAQDRVVNTFHFTTPGPVVTQLEAQAISTRLKSFYNDPHAPGVIGFNQEMSNVLSRSLSLVKVYDITGPAPHPPILSDPWTLGASGGTGLPNEVCLVLSYYGVVTPGVPARRSRGRVYLGPLIREAGTIVAGDDRPAQASLDRLIGAGAFLAQGFGPTQTIFWVVYSPTQRKLGVPLGQYAMIVNKVSCDNAYDTQRRRGRAATVRTFLP